MHFNAKNLIRKLDFIYLYNWLRSYVLYIKWFLINQKRLLKQFFIAGLLLWKRCLLPMLLSMSLMQKLHILQDHVCSNATGGHYSCLHHPGPRSTKCFEEGAILSEQHQHWICTRINYSQLWGSCRILGCVQDLFYIDLFLCFVCFDDGWSEVLKRSKSWNSKWVTHFGYCLFNLVVFQLSF